MTNGACHTKRILIVEDDETTAELIEMVLNGEGNYHAVAAHNSQPALEMVRSFQPHLILMDVRLPGIDGAHLYDIISRNEVTCPIPVAFMTASYNHPELARRNIIDYLLKPFNLDELLGFVARKLDEHAVPQA